MAELMEYLDYTKIFLLISLAGIVLTYIFHLLFRGFTSLAKYIPGFIMAGFGLYSLFSININEINTNGINNLLLFVIGVGGGILGLLFGLILGIYNKEKKVKPSKEE